MNEQSNNTNAAFMEITSKKLETQDKKILAVEEKIKNISSDAEKEKELLAKIEALHKDVAAAFPGDKINNLEKKLDNCISVLQNSKESKVHHQHYVPKIIWIAAGLFITLSLVCSGWLNTHNKLQGYIANDSKYRYLKLDTANRRLQLYLYKVDSLYIFNKEFQEQVAFAEEQKAENLDLRKKAERLKNEANNLEKQAEKK